MRIFAFMTATAVEIAPEAEDSGIELRGWIDKEWSMTTLHDSRNDVRPLMNVDETATDDLSEEISDILGDGSLWEDNGDGDFYSKETRIEDGYEYSYCVHFHRRFIASDGSWAETEWHPENDGGIVLSPESVSV